LKSPLYGIIRRRSDKIRRETQQAESLPSLFVVAQALCQYFSLMTEGNTM
jgi:hypothetical protein